MPEPLTAPQIAEAEKVSEQEVKYDGVSMADQNLLDSGKTSATPAERALGWLRNGNLRYMNGNLRSDGQDAKARLSLVQQQGPHTIVVSCSDARVPPELVFDQKLGELYVIRTAAISIDAAAIASVEFAFLRYRPALIVVLGHNRCDAIDQALQRAPHTSAGTDALNALERDIQIRLKDRLRLNDRPRNAEEEARINAEGVAVDLPIKSALLLQALREGKVLIKYALYDVESGRVTFF